MNCILCRTRKAEVPDREQMGRPIKRVCFECHAARLRGDLRECMRLREKEIREKLSLRAEANREIQMEPDWTTPEWLTDEELNRLYESWPATERLTCKDYASLMLMAREAIVLKAWWDELKGVHGALVKAYEIQRKELDSAAGGS